MQTPPWSETADIVVIYMVIYKVMYMVIYRVIDRAIQCDCIPRLRVALMRVPSPLVAGVATSTISILQWRHGFGFPVLSRGSPPPTTTSHDQFHCTHIGLERVIYI